MWGDTSSFGYGFVESICNLFVFVVMSIWSCCETWVNVFAFAVSQKADLAITDLSITYEREQVLDFTMPWMNLGKESMEEYSTLGTTVSDDLYFFLARFNFQMFKLQNSMVFNPVTVLLHL